MADYFYDNFNTPLTDEDEAKFQRWMADRSALLKRNVADDMYDYDLRGFWQWGQGFADNGHGSDMFKKPNHPTFSDQSIYHGADDPVKGGTFQGGTWTDLGEGKYSFTPSQEMLDKTHAPEWLQRYWDKVEAPSGHMLVLPKSQGLKATKRKD